MSEIKFSLKSSVKCWNIIYMFRIWISFKTGNLFCIKTGANTLWGEIEFLWSHSKKWICSFFEMKVKFAFISLLHENILSRWNNKVTKFTYVIKLHQKVAEKTEKPLKMKVPSSYSYCFQMQKNVNYIYCNWNHLFGWL